MTFCPKKCLLGSNCFQGLRLRRPSMLYTRYFRFGRKFRLSVRLSGRDFNEEKISALEANFGWQEA